MRKRMLQGIPAAMPAIAGPLSPLPAAVLAKVVVSG